MSRANKSSSLPPRSRWSQASPGALVVDSSQSDDESSLAEDSDDGVGASPAGHAMGRRAASAKAYRGPDW